MALRTYLTGIADAIREKKGTSDPINAQDFASEIASISTGGGGEGENLLQALVDAKGVNGGYYLCYNLNGDNVDFLNGIDFSASTNMSHMFYSCYNITTIPLIDTSNVTNMTSMFTNCSRLTTIPLIDTSNVTNMENTFNYCSRLTSIPSLDTSKVTNMYNTFDGCNRLTSIPSLDTSKVTNMYSTFGSCQALQTVPPLNTNSAITMNSMFFNCNVLTTIDITKLPNDNSSLAWGCKSLTKLIIRTMDTLPTFGSGMFNNCNHFTGTYNGTYNPEGLQDGRIYVPDDKVDALKAATGWSDFADLIVPLSTLVED